MKAKRQEKILEIIASESIETQEQLLAALTAAGRWKPSEIHVVSVTSRA